MGTRSVLVCAVSALMACGSKAGWLDGKVAGNEVHVKEAVFIPLPNGELYVAAADQENLCAIVNRQQKPVDEMNALEILLANWDGARPQELVTGSYTATQTASGPGLLAYPLLYWIRDCIVNTQLFPSKGTITLEQIGAAEAGAQTVLSVDLAFGSEHMDGHLNATYCALSEGRNGC